MRRTMPLQPRIGKTTLAIMDDLTFVKKCLSMIRDDKDEDSPDVTLLIEQKQQLISDLNHQLLKIIPHQKVVLTRSGARRDLLVDSKKVTFKNDEPFSKIM